MSHKGVLLINLGSPDSPAVGDVRRYLREFLMDGRVIDSPWPVRAFVVYGCILPFRPQKSAEAYRQVWTPAGSPLVVISQNVRRLLQERVSTPVELAMRYQNPTPGAALAALRDRGVTETLVIPQFPHYAMSSFETAVERVKEVAARVAPGMQLRFTPPFYQDADYVEAMAANARPWLEKDFDLLLFSFHGIPERHLRVSDPTKRHCLQAANCCDVPSPAHATCYRHQCFQTAKAVAARIGLPPEKWSISFQSRLGREPWLKPYTDLEFVRLAQAGVKRLRVICPAFVSDCLETLEEIGMRGRETFLEAGGTDYEMIPCLNEHPLWIAALERRVKEFAG